jgi:predicted aldo/keto reductase-like oxidoreductase
MDNDSTINRRDFIQAAAGAGAMALGVSAAKADDQNKPATSAPAEAKVDPSRLIWRNRQPGMEYARLGRTNYMCSRIVAGAQGQERHWRMMIARGLNYFDTGGCYANGAHEASMGKLLRDNPGKIWVTTKASGIAGFDKVDPEARGMFRKAMRAYLGQVGDQEDALIIYKRGLEKQKQTGEKPDLRQAGERIAKLYAERLDASLKNMGVDSIDCYMMHGVELPWIVDCIELWAAFAKARKAGKVKHFGLSLHKYHKEVLAAAAEANTRGPWQIDLIIAAINPESFDDIRPELAALKKQDVGVIAMKTTGIKNRPLKQDREERFKKLTDGKDYDEYARAKLFMLNLTEGLVDVVIADMGNNEQVDKNLNLANAKLSAEARRELRAIVKLEMSGACDLCGACETNCPEHIAVTDMIRYHAYIHQYDQREMARRLYQAAGYDPVQLCSSCGTCRGVCPSNVPIDRLLRELSAEMG